MTTSALAGQPALPFEHLYAQDLPALVVAWQAAVPPEPRLLYLNQPLAQELGLDAERLAGTEGLAWFSGRAVPPGAKPVAQAYAGHQFGGFSPRLGDGRALLLGELIDRNGRRRDLALKGSGRTPFSRGGDGKAAVGPMLREVLIGEAMHALGIASTRALAVVATGEPVVREQLLPGAVLTRVAASHIRVGTFEFAATQQQQPELLQVLADHTVARHYPALLVLPAGQPQRYLELLKAVVAAQAKLVAQWMNVGFIHGVMNTDNMTLSGETIDYGPCAFMEAYDPKAVFSSIDSQGRYAFGNQPRIAQWNLARLAETLIPLLGEEPEAAVEQLVPIIDSFPEQFSAALQQGQRIKLGLQTAVGPTTSSQVIEETDAELIHDWMALLHQQQMDFTLAHRRLAEAAEGQDGPLTASAVQAEAGAPEVAEWLERWRARCAVLDQLAGLEPPTAAVQRSAALRRANPLVIPRNHQVEAALLAATRDLNLAPFERLLKALQQPFEEIPAHAEFSQPAPAAVTACYRTFCGT